MTELIVEISDTEIDALHTLSQAQQMSMEAVLRQGLRLYQLSHSRIIAGETMTWSGDEQRKKEVLGPLYKEPVPDPCQTHEAKRVFLRGYAEHYPELDPRQGLLGKEEESPYNYKTDGYGNRLIRIPSKFRILVNEALMTWGVVFAVYYFLKALGLEWLL